MGRNRTRWHARGVRTAWPHIHRNIRFVAGPVSHFASGPPGGGPGLPGGRGQPWASKSFLRTLYISLTLLFKIYTWWQQNEFVICAEHGRRRARARRAASRTRPSWGTSRRCSRRRGREQKCISQSNIDCTLTFLERFYARADSSVRSIAMLLFGIATVYRAIAAAAAAVCGSGGGAAAAASLARSTTVAPALAVARAFCISAGVAAPLTNSTESSDGCAPET
jgi:hypothetical protein